MNPAPRARRLFATVLASGLTAALLPVQAGSGTEPQQLSFADFHAHPIGPRGPLPSATLRAAHGQRVQLTGYMVAQERPQPGRFILTHTPLVMSEHADGEADLLPASAVVVLMPPAERELVLPHTRGRLQLTGTLQVGRAEHDDGRISWVRLQLEPRTLGVEAVTAPSTP
jgi:hypothetical protein